MRTRADDFAKIVTGHLVELAALCYDAEKPAYLREQILEGEEDGKRGRRGRIASAHLVRLRHNTDDLRQKLKFDLKRELYKANT